MIVVYVAHPLGRGPDREANRLAASRWCALVAECGFAPIADWIILSGQWGEERRKEGLAIDMALIERCDELWMLGPRISPGMRVEATHALEDGDIKVYDLTGTLEETVKTFSALSRGAREKSRSRVRRETWHETKPKEAQ